MGIKEYLDNIKKAVKGEEVRGSIHDAIKQCYDDATGNPESIAAAVRDIEKTKEEIHDTVENYKSEADQKIAGYKSETDQKVAESDARISEAVKAFNIEGLEKVLWTGTLDGPGQTITLSDPVTDFDYIDFYHDFSGKIAIQTFSSKETNCWIKESNVGNGEDYSSFLQVSEIGMSVSGNKVSIPDNQYVYWYFDPQNGVTTPTRTYTAGSGGRITKIVGRKLVNNAEVLDLRVGDDGKTYDSAGDAVRGQVSGLYESIHGIESNTNHYIGKDTSPWDGTFNMGLTLYGDPPVYTGNAENKGVSVLVKFDANTTYNVKKSSDSNRFRFAWFSNRPNVGDTGEFIFKDAWDGTEVTFTTGYKKLWCVIMLSNSTESKVPSSFSIDKKDGVGFIASVKMFGAKGDGITDDTESIQNALNHANNRILFFPQGTYKVKKTLYVKGGTHIIGFGTRSVIQLAPYSEGYTLDAIPWRTENPSDVAHANRYPVICFNDGIDSVVLENITLKGDKTHFNPQTQTGILVRGGNHILKNVTVNDMNYFPSEWNTSDRERINSPAWGLQIFNAHDVRVENCSFDNNGYQNVGTDTSTNVYFNGCYFGNANRTGFQVHRDANNVCVTNCTINNRSPIGHAGVTMHGSEGHEINGVKFVNSEIKMGYFQFVFGWEKNIEISNCKITITDDQAFFFNWFENDKQVRNHNFVIVGNIMINGTGSLYEPAIKIDCDNLVFANNIIDSSGDNILRFTGQNHSIANNIYI